MRPVPQEASTDSAHGDSVVTYEVKRIAQVNYEAHRKARAKRLCADLDSIPEWIDLPDFMREEWAAAAVAVATEMKKRVIDAFYGFAEIF